MMQTIDQNSQQYKVLSLLYDLLIIIGYDEQEAAVRLQQFLSIAESRVMERVYNRMTPEQQVEFEALLNRASQESNSLTTREEFEDKFFTNYSRIATAVKESVSQNELSILYTEVLNDLLDDYFKTVSPTMTEDQKVAAEEVINRNLNQTASGSE